MTGTVTVELPRTVVNDVIALAHQLGAPLDAPACVVMGHDEARAAFVYALGWIRGGASMAEAAALYS